MNLDFNKLDGLVPAVCQNATTHSVLMVGFMNEESLKITQETGKVTFYSRSKGRLWTKGETSGNFMEVVEIIPDCDQDTLLIKVNPIGPVCHTGTETCFGDTGPDNLHFIKQLEEIIENRHKNPSSQSYTSSLFEDGINKIAQKVGEEAVELVIEAMDDNDEGFKGESADLLFHFLVLLQARGIKLSAVIDVLKKRHQTS